MMKTILALVLPLSLAMTACSSDSFSDFSDEENKQEQGDDDEALTERKFKVVAEVENVSSQQAAAIHITVSRLLADSCYTGRETKLCLFYYGTEPDPAHFQICENYVNKTSPDNGEEFIALNLGNDGKYYGRILMTVVDADSKEEYYSNIVEIDIPAKPEAKKRKLTACDLGLSVLWATTNLGADAEEDAGDHFAWGEVVSKKKYDEEGYALRYLADELTHDSISAKADFDPATAAAGDGWRLPTRREVDELRKKCKWEGVALSGGRAALRLTGPNGGSITLPCAGAKVGKATMHDDDVEDFNGRKLSGYYAVGTRADTYSQGCPSLRFDMTSGGKEEGIYVSNDAQLWWGLSVRAVKDKK